MIGREDNLKGRAGGVSKRFHNHKCYTSETPKCADKTCDINEILQDPQPALVTSTVNQLDELEEDVEADQPELHASYHWMVKLFYFLSLLSVHLYLSGFLTRTTSHDHGLSLSI